jgi:predicted HTH transcriptional regulator
MVLKYDWYKPPVPNHRGETSKLHARVVESGTVDGEFRSLFGLTRTTAARRLAELIAAGKIKKTGHRHSPLYGRESE